MSGFEKIVSRVRRLYDPGELWILLIFLLALWGYFFFSLATNRIFLFTDDILRLGLASLGPGRLFEMHPWGAKTWLPLPMLVDGIAARVLPFGLTADVLLANLTFVSVSAIWIHRLSRRIAPGPVSLIAPALFVISPLTAWLATSALSEPLFIFLLLGECLFLVRSLERGSMRDFGIAATFALLATVCRYEGWFVCPLPLFVVGALNRRRWDGRGIREFLIAAATLVGPVSWMAMSVVRYGDPLAELHQVSGLLKDHNAHQTILMALEKVGEAALTVTWVGWLFLAAGFLSFLAPSFRRRGAFRLPALWIPLLVFAPLLALFLFSIFTRRGAYFLPRFVAVWYSLGIVASVIPLRGVSVKYNWRILLLTIAVSVGVFAKVDVRRPRAFEFLGCRAFERIDSLADHRPASVAILFPKGQGETAINSGFLFALPVKQTWVNPEPGRFAEAARKCSEDFILFQRAYWPDMKPDPGRKIVYLDPYYAVLGWKQGSAPPGGREPAAASR